ncbi:iron-sulfur cluster assembly scaffold protein [Citromicrobium bathyomarinum]
MTKLYTPEILSLAVSLADYPRLSAPDASAEARSRTCGGTLTMDLALDAGNRVEALGLAVSACAIGQAAAAVFAQAAQGRTAEKVRASLKEIEAWLADENAQLPDWPGFAVLEPARAFPGRHGAILLPWRAATDALCKAAQPR